MAGIGVYRTLAIPFIEVSEWLFSASSGRLDTVFQTSPKGRQGRKQTCQVFQHRADRSFGKLSFQHCNGRRKCSVQPVVSYRQNILIRVSFAKEKVLKLYVGENRSISGWFVVFVFIRIEPLVGNSRCNESLD